MKENQKIIIFFFVLFSKIVTGNPKGISTLPSFIENKGQWDKEAMFLSKMNNTNSWILENGSLLIDFYKITIRNSADITSKYHEVDTSRKILGHKVLLNWGNTNQITYSKDKPNEGYTNYLKGNDTAKYAKNVKSFNEIKGHSLYNGIDIKYYFDNNNLRYDLIAEPYANIEQINLSVEGAEQLKIDTDGSVIITTTRSLWSISFSVY